MHEMLCMGHETQLHGQEWKSLDREEGKDCILVTLAALSGSLLCITGCMKECK